MRTNFSFKGFPYGLTIAFLLLTGCAEYHRRVLVCMDENGCEFTRVLAKEYEDLGNIEQNIMYDEYSADYYYRKAIRAKRGYCVGPTTLNKWDIPEDKIQELEQAYAHLTCLLCLGAREAAPEMTAKAQAHFDCWVEQQDEGWQKNDIAWCRGEFYKAISEVEVQLCGGLPEIMPKSMVLFENNSSQLSQEAMDTIEEVVKNEKALKHHHRILLIGRTDKAGDLQYNKDLSQQRALAVKKALIDLGVPPRLISIKASGETPGPNVDAHNRRVDILFLERELSEGTSHPPSPGSMGGL